MEQIYKNNQYFRILLETEQNDVHFSLIQTTQNLPYKQIEKYSNHHLIRDFSALQKAGGYYLMWGPSGEDANYEFHGISPLRDSKNRKWPLKKAMIEFFKAVEASKNQNFVFKKH